MSIEDVIGKIESMDGFDKDDIAELKTKLEENTVKVDDKSAKELKESKAAQARILDEKKTLQAKLAETEALMDDLKNVDLNETEKTQKELEKMNVMKAALEKELEDVKTAKAKTDRSYKLEKISSGVKFLESVPEDMRTYAISTAFSNTEDLDNIDEVTGVLDAFKESHKGVLASETAASGTGSQSPSATPSHSNKSPEDMTDSERAADIKQRMSVKVR